MQKVKMINPVLEMKKQTLRGLNDFIYTEGERKNCELKQKV